MTAVAGACGGRNGWVITRRELDGGSISLRHLKVLSELVKEKDAPKYICIAIPIGLLEKAAPGGRQCEREGRKLLGYPRSACIFSPPVRQAIKAKTFEEVQEINRSTSEHKVGVGRQSFGMLPRIREVDSIMTPKLQKQVRECHPEISFFQMNGEVALNSFKAALLGQRERQQLLEYQWNTGLGHLMNSLRPALINASEILESMAACWTAERVAKKEAFVLPAKRQKDSKGLVMEIVC